jgi:hypothetical protein
MASQELGHKSEEAATALSVEKAEKKKIYDEQMELEKKRQEAEKKFKASLPERDAKERKHKAHLWDGEGSEACEDALTNVIEKCRRSTDEGYHKCAIIYDKVPMHKHPQRPWNEHSEADQSKVKEAYHKGYVKEHNTHNVRLESPHQKAMDVKAGEAAAAAVDPGTDDLSWTPTSKGQVTFAKEHGGENSAEKENLSGMMGLKTTSLSKTQGRVAKKPKMKAKQFFKAFASTDASNHSPQQKSALKSKKIGGKAVLREFGFKSDWAEDKALSEKSKRREDVLAKAGYGER